MKRTDDNRLNDGYIKINNRNIPFIVEYSKNRRKVCPEIREGPKLVVTAPLGTGEEEIYFALNKSLKWIEEKYSVAEKNSPAGISGLSVAYEGKTYEYTLKYDKRTPNFKIKIYADKNIEVIVPAATKQEDADSFVKANASLIHEKISLPAKDSKNKLELKDGGLVLIKGKKVRIKVVRSNTHAGPELKRGILTITLPENPDEDEKRIEDAISGLFKKITQNMTDSLVPKYAKLLGIRIPDTDIIYYERYWGKCIPAKNLVIFNECLAMLPDSLIEYIVAHELCHFYNPNHKPEFYTTLRKIMPDADKRCKRIEKYGTGLTENE